MRDMAALLQLTVTPATQNEFNELDARVGDAMKQAGGPPPSLMSHVVYPEGEGFVVAEVWGMESEGHSYVDDVLNLPNGMKVNTPHGLSLRSLTLMK